VETVPDLMDMEDAVRNKVRSSLLALPPCPLSVWRVVCLLPSAFLSSPLRIVWHYALLG
jgi:hypothetical protein